MLVSMWATVAAGTRQARTLDDKSHRAKRARASGFLHSPVASGPSSVSKGFSRMWMRKFMYPHMLCSLWQWCRKPVRAQRGSTGVRGRWLMMPRAPAWC